jgi:hypothetical protein
MSGYGILYYKDNRVAYKGYWSNDQYFFINKYIILDFMEMKVCTSIKIIKKTRKK